ncbi:hypothetical protein NIES2119_06355 [[Phormidium ambiguum] IAM M-71]|uniref:Uncharacterized protein n=1 Tax=[Phormidium ambiguum] IAM M-71 TaxID=454136 RepID=A0A1U7IPP0_9CYAN|nr:hypothetical protein [Phormidium ambiguum]OKH39359.1 hypothetical protein NIES2119_06355 [Phormidium ambiguum IAM M-71]
MSHEIWIKNSPKAGVQTTQVEGLVLDLTEQEQEMISGFGGRDDGWASEIKITVQSPELQKKWLVSNFRYELSDLTP